MKPHEASASHPTRVRGLKHHLVPHTTQMGMSHPTRVRGLKQRQLQWHHRSAPSHPTRVRGLKPAKSTNNVLL